MEIKVVGINKVIGKLRAYQKSLEDKQKRLLKELADVGIDVADVQFKEAQYDGENDTIVNGAPEWMGDNKLFITATGQSITFIEFGTGVHYVEQHPNAAALGFIRGEFGKGKGSRDTWAYYGSEGTNGQVIKESSKGNVVLTHGNPPARAMYNASKEMRNQVVDIARTVFNSD